MENLTLQLRQIHILEKQGVEKKVIAAAKLDNLFGGQVTYGIPL